MSTRIVLPLASALLLCPAAARGLAAQQSPPRHSAALEYQQVRFTAELEPWHTLSAELQRRGSAGTALVRATTARRFGTSAQQVELELYPRLGELGYGFLAAGYSPNGVFPVWRLAAEIFRNLGHGFEASGGVRYLEFEPATIWLYTGSVGRYIPRWYVSLRPTVARRGGESLFAADLLARRYLGDAGHHVTLRIGAGETPAENLTEADLQRLSSVRAGLDGRAPLSGVWVLRWSAGLEREKLPDDRRRSRVLAGVGLEVSF